MSQRVPIDPKKVVVNLDLPPAERWAFLADDPYFATYKQDMNTYLTNFMPKAAVDVVTNVVKVFKHSYYDEYVQEMEGIAKALKVKIGDIVTVNMIYQLEDIGINCLVRNTTGPCPSEVREAPGLCTGIVADDGTKVWQGRNLDWNLPEILLKYVLQVDYRKGNRTRFIGAQVAGEAGILHGLSQDGGFSAQINARKVGGNVFKNLVDLMVGAKTPSHVLRRALEKETSFDKAVDYLSSQFLANPVYFVVAGAAHGEGVVISRDRKGPGDAWRLYEANSRDTKKINQNQPDWFRLQTNYDHWEGVPSYDDRRTPGIANMKQDCNTTVDQTCIWKVITTWPTQNHHTDVSSVMCPKTGYFHLTVWSRVPPTVLV